MSSNSHNQNATWRNASDEREIRNLGVSMRNKPRKFLGKMFNNANDRMLCVINTYLYT